MSLYAGLDSSTQSLSAIVLDTSEGGRRIVFERSLNFDRDLPEYGTTAGVHRGGDPRVVWSSPVMWADALDRMMGAIARELGPDIARIRAIAGSAQQHGSVYLNASAASIWRSLDPAAPLDGQLVPAFSRAESPVWMDESTTAQCAEIEDALGGPAAVAALTGSRAFERFTGPQIRRFFQERPDAYARTARIHLVSSYLASLLAGRDDAPIDPGDGSGMNLMDLRAGRWSRPALEATAPGLAAKLPPIAPSTAVVGTLAAFWQRRHGLPPARIVAWTGDNPSSLVGTGIVAEGQLAVSLGTSDTVFAVAREPRAGSSHVFGSPAGGFMHLVCFRNGSLARERVRDAHGLDWRGFTRALEETPAGNGGGLMLPWFEPEITPHVPVAGVRRFDLDPADAVRNVRAVIEAQMMAMANHSAAMTPAPIARVVATGGGAANRAILQVMADVFGAEVHVPQATNTACLGAALRAWHADALSRGEPLDWSEVVRPFSEAPPGGRIAPVGAHAAAYVALRVRYAALEAAFAGRAG